MRSRTRVRREMIEKKKNISKSRNLIAPCLRFHCSCALFRHSSTLLLAHCVPFPRCTVSSRGRGIERNTLRLPPPSKPLETSSSSSSSYSSPSFCSLSPFFLCLSSSSSSSCSATTTFTTYLFEPPLRIHFSRVCRFWPGMSEILENHFARCDLCVVILWMWAEM